MEEQIKIKDYFIRGCHKNITCMYLNQSYSCVDMQVIHNNVNVLCMCRQNKYYTKRIYEDFVGSDIMLIEFESFCEECWDMPFDFLMADMTKKVHNGKYKCMLKRVLKAV